MFFYSYLFDSLTVSRMFLAHISDERVFFIPVVRQGRLVYESSLL